MTVVVDIPRAGVAARSGSAGGAGEDSPAGAGAAAGCTRQHQQVQ